MAWYEIIRHNISAVMFMIGFLKTVLKFWVVTKLAIHAIAKMLSAVKNELIQLEEYVSNIPHPIHLLLKFELIQTP